MPQYSKITSNFSTAPAVLKKETLNGRSMLVAPAVMMTVGVHQGNNGPLFYPPEELAANPMTWNSRPAVIYHPEIDGDSSGSAGDPKVLERQGVGLLFSTNYDGRLRTEVWLDEEKLKTVDQRVYDAVMKGEILEVSTGIFHDIDPTPGNYNGDAYNAIVRNIRPDHLAILPDQKGACSVEKGAGLLRNSLTSNAMGNLSASDVRDQASTLIRSDENDCYSWVMDVFDTFIVYERAGKIFRQNYKVSELKVTLTGTPTEVYRVTSYITTNGEQIARPNYNVTNHRGATMPATKNTVTTAAELLKSDAAAAAATKTPSRKEAVSELITKGVWTEADRTTLESMSDAGFANIQKITPEAPAQTTAPAVPPPVAATNPNPPVAAQAPPAIPPAGATNPMSLNQYLEMLPPQVQSVVREGLAAHEREKADLIKKITQNANNRFTQEWLLTQDVQQLRGMAALCQPAQQPAPIAPTINFGGQGVPKMFLDLPSEPTLNAAADVPVLELPTIDWSKN